VRTGNPIFQASQQPAGRGQPVRDLALLAGLPDSGIDRHLLAHARASRQAEAAGKTAFELMFES